MFYGEHLSADEAIVECSRCGIAATVEVVDDRGISHGWFCRAHAEWIRDDLRRQKKIAKAIVRRKNP